MARGSTGVVLGMLADVKDLVRLLRRIAVTVVGTVILAVGVVLLVAPGPGLVVIALAVFGLTVLLTMVYGSFREMRNAKKAEESEDAE